MVSKFGVDAHKSLHVCTLILHMKTFKTFAIWAFVAQTVQTVLIYRFIPISESAIYGTNDDALIASISNGNLTGEYSGYLIFLNPLVSFPIAWLQNLIPNVNIYISFLTFFVTLCFSVILGLIHSEKSIQIISRIILSIFWVLSTITFTSWFVLSPTYTGASIFGIATSAYIAFFYLLNTLENKAYQNWLLFLFIFFFLISISIRAESIYIFVFYLTTILIPILISKKLKDGMIFKKILILAVNSVMIIILTMVAEKLVYNNAEWKAYYETNQLRHKIQLRDPERRLESLYSEVGWDKNTYDLFVRFVLIDESKMNSQNMSKVLEITEENSAQKFIQNFSFYQLVENTKIAFAPWTWIVMLFGLSVLVTILNVLQKSKVIVYTFQVLLFFLGIPVLFLYLSSSYHLPERISVNLLGGLSLILITLSAVNFQNIKKPSVIISSLQILILLVGSFMYLIRFHIELDARQGLYKTWRSIGTQQQQSLSSLPKNTKVIGNATSIKSDWQNPYLIFKSLDQRNLTFVLGWHNLSPVWQKGAQNIGLSPDNLFDNLLSPNILWATNKDDFQTIQEYFTIKLNKQITLEDLGPIGYDQYHLYKVQE